MDAQWDVIVVGGGPGGLSATLMLGRSRRRVLVIDEGRPRNRFAGHVHGLLGNEGTPPAELLEHGRAEAASYGVEFRASRVRGVHDLPHGVSVSLDDGQVLATRALVVSSGMSDELPDVPGLAQWWGRGVLHCPYCHGWEVRDQHLGVLTTSPLGLHQAELVRQLSDHVIVFTAGAGDLDDAVQRRLQSRGVDLIDSPVVEVLGDGQRLTGVRTADERTIPLDAVFTAGEPRPHDAFLEHLALTRRDTPVGSFVAVDPTGRTSHERVWAVGNVVDPMANVAGSIGAGSLVGAAVNGALVAEDFDRALHPDGWAVVVPAEYWEQRYTAAERMWSGRVNQTLADVAADLEPGRALDLGCGEGADAIWLAQRGWRTLAIDIASAAIERARQAAAAAGLGEEQVEFLAADLSDLDHTERFDLVTASFLHSPVHLPREAILRRAADLVADGGHLLITSHAAAPPWADASAHEHIFPTVADELAALDLDDTWETVLAETRSRDSLGPDGNPATLEDVLVLVRRAPLVESSSRAS